MKTPEQWLESWDKANVAPENIEKHLSILKAIQQDAISDSAKRVEELEYKLKATQECLVITVKINTELEAAILDKNAVLKLCEWSRPKQDHLRECPSCHKTLYLNDPKQHLSGCILAESLSRTPAQSFEPWIKIANWFIDNMKCSGHNSIDAKCPECQKLQEAKQLLSSIGEK